jgi:hypothetical protein
MGECRCQPPFHGSRREGEIYGCEHGKKAWMWQLTADIGEWIDLPRPADQPEPHTLAEARRRFRLFLDYGCDCNHFPEDEMELVLAEYDRLRAENAELRELLAIRDEQVEENNAIIEAAYRVAASWSPHSTEEFDGDLVAALVREVQR